MLGLQNLRIIVHTNRYRPIMFTFTLNTFQFLQETFTFFYKPQTKLKPSQANILPVLSQKDPYVITFEPFVRFSNFKKVNQLKFCQGSKNSIGYSLSKKIGPKIVFWRFLQQKIVLFWTDNQIGSKRQVLGYQTIIGANF